MAIVYAFHRDIAQRTASTIQDLVMSLLGAAVAAIVVATRLWPAPGTPRNIFGWHVGAAAQ